MTLDEIEEKIRTLCGSAPTQDGHVRGDVEAVCNIALALVAHVRALENVTRMTDDRAFERITALEAKVAALDEAKPEKTELLKELARARGKTEESHRCYMSAMAALERLAGGTEEADAAAENERLRAENAALKESVTELGLRSGSASMVQDAVEIALKLRAENAELREKLAKTAEAMDNTRQTSFSTTQKLRAENAELRKVNANVHHVAAEYEERIAALEERDRLRTKTVEEQPQWPAPQPIETAPLGEILAGPAPNGFAWAPERPLAGCSLESWRTQLREAERRWWLPMPPPGGAK